MRTRCSHAGHRRLLFTCFGRWLCRTCGMRPLLDHARRRPDGRYLARSLDGDGCTPLRSKHQLRPRGTKTSVREAPPGRPMATCRPTTADYTLIWAGAPRRWPALPLWQRIWSSSATCTSLGHDTAALHRQKGLLGGRGAPRTPSGVHSGARRGAATCMFLRPRATCGVCAWQYIKRTPISQPGARTASCMTVVVT